VVVPVPINDFLARAAGMVLPPQLTTLSRFSGALLMRLSRFLLLSVGLFAVVGCDDDQITTLSPPPLAGVRFINAMADTGAVDIRMIDQVEWSAFALALAFRSGTEHQPTEAKSRRIRVFPTSPDPVVTSRFMLDTAITFTANTNYTLLLTGGSGSPRRFVVLTDDPPACNNNVAVRVVNAGAPSNVDVYIARKAADPLPSQPSAANVAPQATSTYVTRAADTTHVRVTATGTTTPIMASASGPLSPAPQPGTPVRPAAGVNTACSAFSLFVFPRSVAGTTAPQTAPRFTNPESIFFVDRVPPG
jgi:hypothetical protein